VNYYLSSFLLSVLCEPERKMTTENKNFAFEKLTDGNYANWSFRMKHFLIKENLFGTIETEDDMNEAQTKADTKAFSYIVLGVDNSQLVHIVNCESGREAWRQLKSVHVSTSLTAQIRIMRILFKVRLTEAVSMQEHLGTVFDLFNQLVNRGFTFGKKESVAIILSSLSDDYEPLITALEAWDDDKLTMEAVRAKLIEEYSRKHGESSTATESALKAKAIKKCSYCDKFGHLESYCHKKKADQRPRYRSPDRAGHSGADNYANFAFMAVQRRVAQKKKLMARRLCYTCGNFGHYAAVCPKKKAVKSIIVKGSHSGDKKSNNSVIVKRTSNDHEEIEINQVQSAKMSRLNKY